MTAQASEPENASEQGDRKPPSPQSPLLPKFIRRVLIAPAFAVGAALVLGVTPILLLVAAFISRFVPGRWRILRVAWFLLVYLFLEVIALVVLFLMWIACGFGYKLRSEPWQRRHYTFAAWWLARVMGSARRTFRLRIESDDEHEHIQRSPNPVLVFSRHAGPGDSFLLIDGVLNGADRRPRIVLKETLQFDPTIDVLLNRVPTKFVPGHGGSHATADAIGELASTMGSDDALVLFPEGGNFTPARHARAVEKLLEIGRPILSERASKMRHVLPPKPLGALTAIEAAPDADVVFVGHVGLEQLSTLADLWRGIPLDASIRTRLWRVPATEIPPPDEQESWLYDQWEMIDDWIDEQLSEDDDPDVPGFPSA